MPKRIEQLHKAMELIASHGTAVPRSSPGRVGNEWIARTCWNASLCSSSRQQRAQTVMKAFCILIGARAALKRTLCVSRSAKPKAMKEYTQAKKFGPKKLKSGYWQEDVDIDDDIDVFEWFNAEELLGDPPVQITNLREVAKYTIYPDGPPEDFDGPDYRPPPPKIQLAKGLKDPPMVDQGLERSFTADMRDEIAKFGDDGFSLQDADVVISFPALRTLLAFVDGTLTEDMRAKGLNNRRGSQAERIDLCRVGRLPDAPGSVFIGTVWNWVPENATAGTANFNKRSYDVNFEQVVSGRETVTGPYSVRELDDPVHYRVLHYEAGALKLAVRVPMACTVPRIDSEAMPNPGMSVECSTANERDSGELWGHTLSSKLAEMQFGNIGMLARAVVDKGSIVDLQELTQDDLKLDRPGIAQETEALMGRLIGLLKRVKQVADYPGCCDRVLYLQYCDAELRLIAPWSDEDLEMMSSLPDLSNQEVESLLFGG